MRKKLLFIVLFILALLYLQFGRGPHLNNTITSSNSAGYELTLTITANKLLILNRDSFVNSLIEQTVQNEWKNIQFSYDMQGYPNKLTIYVYANPFFKRLDLLAFRAKYVQETPYLYDIKENPEKFTISYD